MLWIEREFFYVSALPLEDPPLRIAESYIHEEKGLG